MVASPPTNLASLHVKCGVDVPMPVGSIGPTRARCFKKLEALLADLGVDGTA